MSAFIVTNGTIDRVVEAFISADRVVAAFCATGERPNQGLNELGAMLAEMNMAAFYQRYGEREPVEPYAYTERFAPPAAMFKGCACLKYQCTEGNVPDRARYQLLDEVERAMARKLAGVADPDRARDKAWQMSDSEPWDFAD